MEGYFSEHSSILMLIKPVSKLQWEMVMLGLG